MENQNQNLVNFINTLPEEERTIQRGYLEALISASLITRIDEAGLLSDADIEEVTSLAEEFYDRDAAPGEQLHEQNPILDWFRSRVPDFDAMQLQVTEEVIQNLQSKVDGLDAQ